MAQLANKLSAFWNRKAYAVITQEPAIGPYPEPD
jgi:hypothetical protein